MMKAKYRLYCTKCGAEISDFGQWFAQGQKCSCGCSRAEIRYAADYSRLSELLEGAAHGLFHYFDFLPLNDRANAVSLGEGTVPLERWKFLEDIALRVCGLHLQVVVSRSDLSGGTGSFKDPAAALGASLFKEWGVNGYCIASTGNSATAFSRYCAEAQVPYRVFVPSDVNPETVEAIRSHGNEVVIVEGGYGAAKKAAADWCARTGTLISPGNIDPIRVESKRTLVFEYLRQLRRMPDVYIQAVAGGTAPIALDKGVREIGREMGGSVRVGGSDVPVTLPRMILSQQDTCDPMVQAWEKASASGFPEGWEADYPCVTPHTKISILTAGTPGNYPIVAPIVRRSGGSFVRVKESSLASLAASVLREKGFVPGPASMVCIAGFLQALEQGLLHDGELVSVNMGEGCSRSGWFREEVEKVILLTGGDYCSLS